MRPSGFGGHRDTGLCEGSGKIKGEFDEDCSLLAQTVTGSKQSKVQDIETGEGLGGTSV